MADGKAFFYKTWGGRLASVQGVDSVEFPGSHVVFKNSEGEIILAERIENVSQLMEHISELSFEDAKAEYREMAR